jgi:YHS domain-containing protein
MKNNKLNNIVTVGGFALALLFVTGCAPKDAPAADATPTKTEVSTPVPTESTPAAFTNAKGEIVCPVMGTVIASADKAVGHQDYEGKRYYFCCDGCPDQFKADPAKYATGKDAN